MKRMVKKIAAIIFWGMSWWLLISLGPNTPKVLAENLESNSYIIQFGNFNMGAEEQTGETYDVTTTLGQNFAGPYGEYGVSNYFLGSGFQYIYQIKAFRFRLGSTLVDLGLLTSSAHNTATHDIYVTAPGAGGYSVYTYELHPLQTLSGDSAVADTTCDNNDCDEDTAGEWINPDIGGFGFNVSGDDKIGKFLSDDYFMQFANRATNEPMQIIMSSAKAAFDRTASVTYKAGLRGSEAAGRYQTGIVYVAVPGY